MQHVFVDKVACLAVGAWIACALIGGSNAKTITLPRNTAVPNNSSAGYTLSVSGPISSSTKLRFKVFGQAYEQNDCGHSAYGTNAAGVVVTPGCYAGMGTGSDLSTGNNYNGVTPDYGQLVVEVTLPGGLRYYGIPVAADSASGLGTSKPPTGFPVAETLAALLASDSTYHAFKGVDGATITFFIDDTDYSNNGSGFVLNKTKAAGSP